MVELAINLLSFWVVILFGVFTLGVFVVAGVLLLTGFGTLTLHLGESIKNDIQSLRKNWFWAMLFFIGIPLVIILDFVL